MSRYLAGTSKVPHALAERLRSAVKPALDVVRFDGDGGPANDIETSSIADASP
jgi:hypothetical protein